ncbi:MAG: N-acyl homoserine lactonase family protein [Actinomycetia bacterium]|nr:N-acyl homoserine lactonase family protein [Actinomycetes bacterium]
MKLYVFDGGRAHLPDLSHLTPDRNFGRPVTIPLFSFLIDHPRGLVVVDTGVDTDDARDPVLEVEPAHRIDRQMQRLGYAPGDVKYVVLTHLHLDHTGGMTLFPDATFIVRRSELRAAWWPDAYERGYDFDNLLAARGFRYLQPPGDEAFDVFEDGSVVCFDTKGHTEGHQSVLVDLPRSGKIVLTGDAVQVAENLTDSVPPGMCWNSQMAVQAIAKLRHLQETGALLIFGHELSLLESLKIAPAYYD